MPRHHFLPKKTAFVLYTITLLLSLGLFANSIAEPPPADSTGHRFFVGYERGLSFRYFPARLWGFGLEGRYSFADSPVERKGNSETMEKFKRR